MTSSRLFAVFMMLLALGLPLNAGAGPGDPRLVNGILEWPAVLTGEPFVIVRGDDSAVYHVTVAATRRAGAVTAGARVSVLGIEGRTAQEIIAVGLGSGPSAEAALADLQAAPAKIAPAPPAPVTPAVSTPPAPANAPSGPTTVLPSSPATPTSPPATEAAAAPKPPAAAPKASGPKPTAPEPAVVPAATTTAQKTTTPPPSAATVPLVAPSQDQRWVELTGEVERMVGRTLVLKVDGGRVSVDVSGLNANLERAMAPGTMVKVYGVPVELKFKAMGIMQ